MKDSAKYILQVAEEKIKYVKRLMDMPNKSKIKSYKKIENDVLTIVEDESYQLRIGENPDNIDLDAIEKINVWDKSVKVEENGYYWKGDPFITKGKILYNDKPLVVELFCGCGGTSLGFELAGYEIAIGCDIHQPSINTFKTNHANVSTVLGDVRKVNPKSLLQLLDGRQVDVLIGGVPCQGFSLNNRKRHEYDERNLLYKEFIRFVKALEPKVIMLENVSGMKSTGDFVETIEKDLSAAGNMKVKSKLLFAPDYGVPQSRTRLVFIGIRGGEEFVFSEIKKTHGFETKKPYVTIKDAIGDLPSLNPNEISTKYIKEPFSEYQKLMRKNMKDDKLTNHKAPNHPQEVIEKIKNTEPGKPMYPKFKQRIRLAWDIQSPTQVSGGIRPQFQFGHPSDNRGLTIRERCRLQSFPDNFIVGGGIVQGRVQTGNAVPPLLAKAIALAIKKYL